MFPIGVRSVFTATLSLSLMSSASPSSFAQLVIERGPLGKPTQVMDETKEWTTPLKVASDQDVEMYIPDVSSPDWLKLNYRDYYDRGYYTLSLYTFYRTPRACQQNQIAWGKGDKAHLDACMDIGYRVRTARIMPHDKSATLLSAAMILQNGQLDPNSIEDRGAFRFWRDLDANTQKALDRATALVEAQMKDYDRRQQGLQ